MKLKFDDRLVNHCYSCLIDGSTEASHITIDDAAYTLLAWADEDPKLIAEIGNPLPSEFMRCWNHVCDVLTA